MSCCEWEEQMYLYFDDGLSSDKAEVLLAHIQQCESCATLFAEIQEVNDLLKEEAAIIHRVPEDFSSRVMAALPDAPWKTKQDSTEKAEVATVLSFPEKRENKKSFVRWGSAFAAAVLVAAVGIVQLTGEGVTPLVNTPGGISVVDNQPVGNEEVNAPGIDEIDENPQGGTVDQPVAVDPVDAGQQTDVPVTTPKEQKIPETSVAGSGEVALPQVAAGKEKNGIFSILMLAACEDGDVLNPVIVDSDTVEYYIRSQYGTGKWQSKISTTESSLVEEKAKLGAAQGINTVKKAEWLTDSSYTEAISPLGDMTLLNSMAENGGLWKITNSENTPPKQLHKASGGNILSWSPDGTKAVYTDSVGNLYAVYPTEEVVMLVFEGAVSSVAWGEDNCMIAFCATTPDRIYSAVYSAELP